MEWLLVATAIRLVTAVGSVDHGKNNIYICSAQSGNLRNLEIEQI